MSILTKAEELVNKDRQADYGSPLDHFMDVSVAVSALIGKTLTPQDCIMVMLVIKLSRENNKHKEDNLVDICGYSEILNRFYKDE